MLHVAAALLLVGSLGVSAAPEAGKSAPPIWGRIDAIGAEPFSADTLHSYVGFSIGFMGMTKVRGAFKKYDACVLFDEKDPTRSSATVVVDPASIDTAFESRDKDLRSSNFFDVEKFPRILFQTVRIERTGPDRYLVHGMLEIKGVQRPIDLPMAQTVARMPDTGWGNIRIGGAGAVTIRRSDFGILGNDFWGKKVLADDVEVTIELLAIRSNHDLWGFDSKEKPSIGEVMWKTFEENGIDAALAKYRELKEKRPDDYNFAASQLAIVGHRLFQRSRLQEALSVYELALAAGPKDPSAIRCKVGEVHAGLGAREAAVADYRRVLEVNKDNAEALEMIRRLEAPSAR